LEEQKDTGKRWKSPESPRPCFWTSSVLSGDHQKRVFPAAFPLPSRIQTQSPDAQLQQTKGKHMSHGLIESEIMHLYARAVLILLKAQMSLIVEVLSNYWLFHGQNMPDLLKLLGSVADSQSKVPTLPPQDNYSLPHAVILAREQILSQEKVSRA
jgi:hypothetical protein